MRSGRTVLITELRPYSFIRTELAVYRTFGERRLETGQIPVLLRYYKDEAGMWRKPPKYSAEAREHAFLRHYDVPTLTIPEYGIAVGILDVDSPNFEVLDPRAAARRLLPADYLELDGSESLGLVGSRLVGLSTSVSDLDLVVYGPDECGRAQRLLGKLDRTSVESSSVRRFVERVQSEVSWSSVLGERNIFSGTLPGDLQRTRKVDVHYSPSEWCDDVLTPAATRTTARSERFRVTINDASQRHLFPGCVYGVAGNRDVRLWIKDHALQFVLEGDVVEFDGYTLTPEHGIAGVVCEDIQSIQLREKDTVTTK